MLQTLRIVARNILSRPEQPVVTALPPFEWPYKREEVERDEFACPTLAYNTRTRGPYYDARAPYHEDMRRQVEAAKDERHFKYAAILCEDAAIRAHGAGNFVLCDRWRGDGQDNVRRHFRSQPVM